MNNKYLILITLSLILFTAFISTSLLSYFSARESLSQEIEQSTLPLTGDNIYSDIQQDLLRPIFISSLMAHDTFVRDWVLAGEQDQDAITRYLKEIQNRYETDSSFFVSERSRRYYHANGMLKVVDRNDPQDRWYFDFKNNVAPYEINIDWDTANPNNLSVFINYKVYDFNGQLIGATGVGLSTVIVKQLVNEYQSRYNREVFFADKEGAITLHSDAFQGAITLRDDNKLSRYATRILSQPSSHFSFTDGLDTVYINSRFIPEFNWYLLVQQRTKISDDHLFHTLLMNLIGSGIITLLVLALAWVTISKFQRRLEEMAHTDKLTGLANRQMLDISLPRLLALSQRHNEPLSCILADLDGFKAINDQYGHPAGDKMIRATAELFARSTRQTDLVCRWGGDEFLFILPNCDKQHALYFAEKLRQNVEKNHVKVGDKLLNLSLSMGIAQWRTGETDDQLLTRADHALLIAKRSGRNCVRVQASDPALDPL